MNVQDSFDSLRQLPNETVKAYTAFLDYVNMGGGRSLRKLQAEYRRQTVARPPSTRLETLTEWSKTHKWQDRLKAYATEVQQRQLATQKQRLDRFTETVWEFHDTLAEHVRAQLAEYEKNKIAKKTRVPDPRNPAQEIEVVYMKTNLRDLMMLVDMAGKLGKDLRAQLGLPTPIDVTSGGEPLKGYMNVSPDEWDRTPEGEKDEQAAPHGN